MATSKPGAQFADYLELLKVLSQSNAEALVVGGQAVNLWAEIFEADEPGLRQYRPFTSADLDLHRTDAAGRQLLRAQARHIENERDRFGKAFTIVSQTFLVERPGGGVLPVEELKMVAGLTPSDIKRGTLTVEFSGVRIRALGPITCLKAKLYNLRNVRQEGRQDLKHARILMFCTRAFIRRLLGEAESEGKHRPALNALKEILRITSPRAVIQTARAFGLNLAGSLPLEELAASQNPKVARFVGAQLPRWRELQDSTFSA